MDPSEGVDTPPVVIKPAKPRKRFVGTSAKASSSTTRAPIRKIANQIPDDILHDPELNSAIAGEL
jgi:2-(3-amino-3-carboxypropyl)histidine synthase